MLSLQRWGARGLWVILPGRWSNLYSVLFTSFQATFSTTSSLTHTFREREVKTRGDDDDDNTTHTLTHNLVFVVGLMSRQSTLFLIFFLSFRCVLPNYIIIQKTDVNSDFDWILIIRTKHTQTHARIPHFNRVSSGGSESREITDQLLLGEPTIWKERCRDWDCALALEMNEFAELNDCNLGLLCICNERKLHDGVPPQDQVLYLQR